jgi:dUTPase
MKEHAGMTHKLIYYPDEPELSRVYFAGNAVVLHIGELAGEFEIAGQDVIALPPGKFIFCLTREAVNLPFDINGTLFQNPKISNLGLLFFTLGHVDAGFHGHLTCTFLNTTDKTIKLKRHQDVLYLVLSRVEKSHYPRFARDFHREPQLDMSSAQRNLNLAPAFAFTKADFATRSELYKWVGIILAVFGTVVGTLLAVIRFLPNG